MLYASDFRKIAREALQNKWGLAIITGLVASLLGGASGPSLPDFNWREEYSTLGTTDFGRYFLMFFWLMFGMASLIGVVLFVIGSTIRLGYIRFNRNLLDRTNPQFQDIFSKFSIFGKAFLLQLLIFIYTFLWFLLFIIPGIIASFSYAMAPYILEENPNMPINEAIARSKEMMRGNKWRLFCLGISFIGWYLLSIVTCGIGFLWLIPYINAADAAFYYDVSGKYNGQNGPWQNQQFQQDQQYNQQYQQNQYNQQYQQSQSYQQNNQNGQQQNQSYYNQTNYTNPASPTNQTYSVNPVNPINPLNTTNPNTDNESNSTD